MAGNRDDLLKQIREAAGKTKKKQDAAEIPKDQKSDRTTTGPSAADLAHVAKANSVDSDSDDENWEEQDTEQKQHIADALKNVKQNVKTVPTQSIPTPRAIPTTPRKDSTSRTASSIPIAPPIVTPSTVTSTPISSVTAPEAPPLAPPLAPPFLSQQHNQQTTTTTVETSSTTPTVAVATSETSALTRRSLFATPKPAKKDIWQHQGDLKFENNLEEKEDKLITHADIQTIVAVLTPPKTLAQKKLYELSPDDVHELNALITQLIGLMHKEENNKYVPNENIRASQVHAAIMMAYMKNYTDQRRQGALKTKFGELTKYFHVAFDVLSKEKSIHLFYGKPIDAKKTKEKAPDSFVLASVTSPAELTFLVKNLFYRFITEGVAGIKKENTKSQIRINCIKQIMRLPSAAITEWNNLMLSMLPDKTLTIPVNVEKFKETEIKDYLKNKVMTNNKFIQNVNDSCYLQTLVNIVGDYLHTPENRQRKHINEVAKLYNKLVTHLAQAPVNDADKTKERVHSDVMQVFIVSSIYASDGKERRRNLELIDEILIKFYEATKNKTFGEPKNQNVFTEVMNSCTNDEEIAHLTLIAFKIALLNGFTNQKTTAPLIFRNAVHLIQAMGINGMSNWFELTSKLNSYIRTDNKKSYLGELIINESNFHDFNQIEKARQILLNREEKFKYLVNNPELFLHVTNNLYSTPTEEKTAQQDNSDKLKSTPRPS